MPKRITRASHVVDDESANTTGSVPDVEAEQRGEQIKEKAQRSRKGLPRITTSRTYKPTLTTVLPMSAASTMRNLDTSSDSLARKRPTWPRRMKTNKEVRRKSQTLSFHILPHFPCPFPVEQQCCTRPPPFYYTGLPN